MFGWFKSKLKTINDPVFGEMVFMYIPKGKSYWEAVSRFVPTGKEIELFVDADENGPGKAQYELYGEIIERYDQLRTEMFQFLKKETEKWERSSIPDLWDVIVLTAISIPEKETTDMEWELMFESRLTGTPHFDVKFRGWLPTGVIEIST